MTTPTADRPDDLAARAKDTAIRAAKRGEGLAAHVELIDVLADALDAARAEADRQRGRAVELTQELAAARSQADEGRRLAMAFLGGVDSGVIWDMAAALLDPPACGRAEGGEAPQARQDGPAPAATRGIYVASRASVSGRAEMWRRLRSEGWPIVSTWIDEDGPGQTEDLGELWARIAREVTTSAGLVLYAEPGDFPLKGALVEVGMALAAGVPVVVVAPGVDVNPRSCRPIGSWMRHPLVGRAGSAVEAFRRLGATAAAPAAGGGEGGTDAD